MATARFIIRAALAAALTAPLAPVVFAQDQIPPQVENSKVSMTGRVNSDAVYVHSGAGQNYYPTMKLNKGDQVTIVGYKFDWLKIVPPDGSFSYVGKLFIERTGDGSQGRVTRPDVRVRAGSTLNEFKGIVQAELQQGQDVKILGEKDEYFMIAPPEGAFVYVNKQFVDPVQVVEAPAQVTPVAETPQSAETPVEAPVVETVAAPLPTEMTADTPADEAATDTTAAAPTTAPATPTADMQFDEVEAAFTQASTLPLDQQPLDELKSKYDALLADSTLPESMRRIAEFHSRTVGVRIEMRDEYVALQKEQAEAEKRQQAMKAEQEELAQQIAQNTIKLYTAVGTLQTSSLQQGKEMLYRLTDPATGRTVVYIRSNDPAMSGFLGQFIGVEGELESDPRLAMKVISPTKTETTNPAELYHTVAATVVPPSLLPAAQVTTTAE